MSRPGDRLRAFAASWCNDHRLMLVIDPAIADLERDRSIRSYVGVLKVVLWCATGEVMMSASGWTPDDRRALTRALAGIAIVTILAMLGSEAPFLRYLVQPDGVDRRVVLYLLP